MRWDQWHPVRSPSDSLLRSWAPVAARRRVKSLRGCQLLQCWTRWVPDLERVAIYLRCLLLPLVLGNTARHATARRGRGGDRAPIRCAGGGTGARSAEAGGVSAEMNYSSTLDRFDNFQEDAQLAFLSQELYGWLYHYAYNVGTAVLIAASSMVALHTGVLPRWLACLVRPGGSIHPAAPLSHPTGLLAGTALVRYGCCTHARRWRWVYRRPAQIHRTP